MSLHRNNIAVASLCGWPRIGEQNLKLLNETRAEILLLFDDLHDERPGQHRRERLGSLGELLYLHTHLLEQDVYSSTIPEQQAMANARSEQSRERLARVHKLIAELDCIPPATQRFDHGVKKLEWATRNHLVEQHRGLTMQADTVTLVLDAADDPDAVPVDTLSATAKVALAH